MAGFIDHEKAFISLFNQTARYHHRHKVFEDFVSCSVIALRTVSVSAKSGKLNIFK